MLIHMLRNMLTNILVKSSIRGCEPALLRTSMAIRRAISYLDKAAATVKPPRRSIMTGVHIDANAAVVASLGPRRLYGFSSEHRTRSTTTRNGTSSDVTKRGMTCLLATILYVLRKKTNLRSPQKTDKDQHSQTVLLLGLLHNRN